MITVDGTSISIMQGDTGTVTIQTSGVNFESTDRALFTIKDNNRNAVRRNILEITNNAVTISFTHDDTKAMRIGDYTWDIRFIVDPEYEDEEIVDGTVIDTPYTDMRFHVGRTVGDI